MKKLVLILVLAAFSFAGFSQTVKNVNPAGLISKKVTTTNATATKVDTIAVATNEIGTIVVSVVGLKSDGSAAITGTKSYRYSKASGTITIATATIDPEDSLVVDTGVSTSTFAASASSDNNILVKVTGKASTTIYWRVIVKQFAIAKDE
jgi:hypothetical protein